MSVANNGKEALDLLYRQHFDCVLMDMQMPVMDGLEATRLIRADAGMAGMPVIAMTANVSNADRERCRAVGMDDFVSKPFKSHVLYATVAKWLTAGQDLSGVSVAPSTGISSAGDADIIDLSILEEMMSAHPERIPEMAHRFVASTQADIAEIEKALERSDMEALSALAHRTKSPARMVGAIGFANLCQSLENCVRSGNIERTRDIVNQLTPLLQQIRQKIAAL